MPRKSGFYWAIPWMPEDAYPTVVFVMCDDGIPQIVDGDECGYRLFSSRIMCPDGWQ